jgi:hypothetical protein
MPNEINGYGVIIAGHPRPWNITVIDLDNNRWVFEVLAPGEPITAQHSIIEAVRAADEYGMHVVSGDPDGMDGAYDAADRWILDQLHTVPAGPRTAAEYDVDPSGTVEQIRPDRPQRPTHIPPTAHSVRTFGALPTGTEFSWQSRKWRKMTDTKAKEMTGQPGRPTLVTMNPTEEVL